MGVFSIYSLGVATGRDAWSWGFASEQVGIRMKAMIDRFNQEVDRYQLENPRIRARDYVEYDPRCISWNDNLWRDVERGKRAIFSSDMVVLGVYRPFCKQYLYAEPQLLARSYQAFRLYPVVREGLTAHNVAIMVPGKSNTAFNCLITDTISDLNGLNAGTQCFPLYYYEPIDDTRLFDTDGVKVIKDAWGNRCARRDAITDTALAVFQRAYPHTYLKRAKKYGGVGINKEDIFYYIYGVLHSTEYRERFASNLAKELPRVPLVDDFEGFVEAGRKLADLHLHYEDLKPWPTVETGLLEGIDPGKVVKMRWAKKKDPETGRRVNDYTTLIFNANVTITGIPETAQNYVVNGRSPLDWMIDRYQVKTDKKSGNTNDPNEYSDDPCYIVNLVGKLVRVAMETNGIVSTLPPIKEIPHPDNWPAEWTTV